jgi:uncharacterized protein (TIGR03000 family)
MLRQRFLVLAAVLSLAAVLLAATPAEAQRRGGGWRGGGWSGGGWRGGGWGRDWDGGWGRGWGWGGVAIGLGSGSYAGGYYPGYAYGGYYPGYASSYGSPFYTAYPSGFVTDGYAYTGPATMATQSSFYPPSPATTNPNVAHVHVRVPADATVWFEGDQMTQTGTERDFVSPPLTPGQNYSYDVKARWMRDGQPVEQSRTVRVRAGETSTVDFNAPAG